MSEESQTYFERLVDRDALAAFLEADLGPADHYEITRHEEGHSNETLFVDWGDRELVLRRPPPGETAETAHDVLREYRVIDALQDTAVPVPPTVTACDDHDVIGSDFYIMERVHGVVLRTDEDHEVFSDPADRRHIGTELVDTLAAIHGIEYDAVGLGELGHPPGYTQRQVDRWGKQLDWAFDVTAAEREVPTLDQVGRWLDEHCPEAYPHTMVHGDYKLDNVMFATEPPVDLVAVFDWEMATLGDPRADLGWMLSYWWEEKDEAVLSDTSTTFMAHPDYASRADLVARWESQTGYSFEHERFYRALAVYKLAALGEMFFRRYLEGNSDDETYPLMEERVPALADRALRIIEGDEPL